MITYVKKLEMVRDAYWRVEEALETIMDKTDCTKVQAAQALRQARKSSQAISRSYILGAIKILTA